MSNEAVTLTAGHLEDRIPGRLQGGGLTCAPQKVDPALIARVSLSFVFLDTTRVVSAIGARQPPRPYREPSPLHASPPVVEARVVVGAIEAKR